MIITISGDIGSGKSTVGKLLVKELGYEFLSTGRIQRKIADEMGLTTLELNLLSEKNREIDDRIDAYTKALNDSDENYIVDSRLAWHFIPSSFKVFLQCTTEEATRRIFNDDDRSGEKKEKDPELLLAKILNRRESERRRFKDLYGVDYALLYQYDLVVNTTEMTPEQVKSEVLKHFGVWMEM